jgi:hypothetical protein
MKAKRCCSILATSVHRLLVWGMWFKYQETCGSHQWKMTEEKGRDLQLEDGLERRSASTSFTEKWSVTMATFGLRKT